METDPLTRAWASRTNHLSEEMKMMLVNRMLTDLNARRHRATLFFGIVGAVLAVMTGVALMRSVAGGTDFSQEWGLVPMLGLCWGLLILMGLRHHRHLRDHGDPNLAVPTALTALMDANRAARQRLMLVAGGWVLMAPLLGLALVQMQDSGKMAPAHAGQFAMLAALAAGIVALVAGVRYWHRLRPEQHQLQQLLRDYQGGV